MEPQKVEVPMSGCIMVPTASPQSRNVPMPTYEPPLVSIVFQFSSPILFTRVFKNLALEIKIIRLLQNTLKRC